MYEFDIYIRVCAEGSEIFFPLSLPRMKNKLHVQSKENERIVLLSLIDTRIEIDVHVYTSH